jgi:phenylacetaldehyde dehydrogenase
MNAVTSISPRLDALKARLASAPKRLFIDGEWREAESGETFDVLDPSSGAVIAKAAAGAARDIDLAVAAARRAFEGGAWPRLAHAERARLLFALADAVEAEADDLALTESLDGGNPVRSTRAVDVAAAIESLRYNAGWATKLTGDTALSSAQGRSFSYTLREPVGVVGAITPWNAPLLMAVNKLAPALAVGCTVVLKPAELTPLSALRLAELIDRIGFPRGVVNVVTGFGATAGQALAEHRGVNKLSFTGSTRVGRSILAAAAGNLKRVTLELGGKSPVIIFPDADVEAATAAASSTIFFKTGQFCAAGTRLFVHEQVFDRVMQGFSERARKLKVGPGTSPESEMGPIVSAQQLERVMGYIDAGASQGAEIVTGGQRMNAPGYFVEPTLLAGVRPDMSVFQEEIFGPVLCGMPFADNDDLDALARLANDTSYGLAASIWTRDIRVAHALARKIHAGTISINGGTKEMPLPFGGYKQSGIGREGGRDGIHEYTEIKTVSIGGL